MELAMKNARNNTVNKALLLLSLLGLQACATQPQPYRLDVVQAISSSDGIIIAPYDRSIFSSSNF